MRQVFKEMQRQFRSTFDPGVERVLAILIGICFVASLVFLALAVEDATAQEPTSVPTPTATSTPTPTATPTVDPEVQAMDDRITMCLDSMEYYYLSRTGIQLEPLAFLYAVTDSGAEITGTADAENDERLTGVVDFKCVFEDFMDVPLMLTEIEVTEGE
jgi:hypothetical protein